MPWVRQGECCRCGECCHGDPYENAPHHRSDKMKRRPPVPGMCPLYEMRFSFKKMKRTGFCIGHTGAVPAGQEDPYYLAGCNAFPEHPDSIKDYPSCTYTFRWQDD